VDLGNAASDQYSRSAVAAEAGEAGNKKLPSDPVKLCLDQCVVVAKVPQPNVVEVGASAMTEQCWSKAPDRASLESMKTKRKSSLGIQHTGKVVYTRIVMQSPEIPRTPAELNSGTIPRQKQGI
jgi:hypothetical protein